MSELYARLSFAFNKSPFVYNKETGGGMKVMIYNMFTDTVTVRHSLRGYVTNTVQHDRKKYLQKLTNTNWEPS